MARPTHRDYKTNHRKADIGRLREFGIGALAGVVLASAVFIYVGDRHHTSHDAAADVPADLGDLALDVAAIGEKLAVAGNPNLRSDACAASLLASAVASSAAILVEENLRGRAGDTRIMTARAHAAAAAACARRAVAAGGDSTVSDSETDSGPRSSR